MESESNDTRATADPLTLGSAITGQLSCTTDVDYYSVAIGSAGILSIAFDAPTNSTVSEYFKVAAYDGAGAILAQWEAGADKTWTVPAPAAGTYYISVAAVTYYYDSGQ